MSQVRKDILNGWKEIATYVGRDIRTVERWEKQRGLPIRRVPGDGRATVYAVVAELDRWFASAETAETMGDAESPNFPAPNGNGAHSTANGHSETHAFLTPSLAALDAESTVAIRAQDPAAVAQTHSPRWMLWTVLTLVVLAAAGLTWRHRRRALHPALARPAASATNSNIHYSFDLSQRTPGVPYPSRVAGVDDIYLSGEYYNEQRTPESLARAAQCYLQAIAKDPNYAPAYAGLSITYDLEREYSIVPDEVAYPRAKEAAERAVELDAQLPQAHVSLGFIDFFWSGDPVAAEHEFRRALALDPSLVSAHHWYGSVLTHEGRYPEALDQLGLAQRLEPTSAAVLSSRALALGMSGHRGEAMDMLQELLNDVPNATSPHQMLAILSMIEPRDIPRYLDETRRVARMRDDKSTLDELTVAEPAYRNGGEPAMWKAIYDRELRLHPPPEQPTYRMGTLQAVLGNKDAAFAILVPYAKRHDRNAVTMNMNPLLSGLRGDPRFAQLLAYTGIPEAMAIH